MLILNATFTKLRKIDYRILHSCNRLIKETKTSDRKKPKFISDGAKKMSKAAVEHK